MAFFLLDGDGRCGKGYGWMACARSLFCKKKLPEACVESLFLMYS